MPPLLLLFPVLAALGRYATVDLSPRMFPNVYVAVCAVTVLPASLSLFRGSRWRGALPTAFVALVVAWVVWAPATLVWAPDVAFGIDRISLVSGALISGVCVLGLVSRMPSGLRLLRLGWTGAFVVTAGIALWELSTGRHLDAAPGAIRSAYVVTSTFYNPNSYSGFLLSCLPFLTWNGIAARSWAGRYLHLVLVALCLMLIVATQSRTGVIGAMAALPVIGVWVVRAAWLRRRPILLPTLFLGLPIAVALAFLSTTTPAQQILTQLQAQFVSDGISESDQARLNLTMLGWRMFLDSGLLGQGAGSFGIVSNYWTGIETFGLTNAHNGVIEVAAEYGLPVLVPLLAVVCVLAFWAVFGPFPASSRAEALDLRMATGLGLAAVVASNLVASSVLMTPSWWLLLGQMTAQAWLLPQIWSEAAGRTGVRDPGAHRTGQASRHLWAGSSAGGT
ncbi:O-antigen ligase family protein [Micromonospora echinospora]|uniref:Teichuronic acid biosynthesis protein TuaE n=1 Tax=Micromonospora echinospora TaxID=1877 RepID=A0ABR6MBZ7_MICEC|nr:O-antigen ligase family protein [Micromonospora echinospora]MBB5112908.1 teichuronic acid biosynthesis protein TuaE [Micromonospora echinospora]